MIQFNIEVLSVSPVSDETGKGGGKYKKLEVAYKRLDRDGKVEGKPIFDFANKDIFKAVSELHVGDVKQITAEKNDGGYWQWTAIDEPAAPKETADKPADASPARKSYPAKAGVGKVTGSNYETPEERAIRRAFEVEKQKYIVAQSSISNAIAALDRVKGVVTDKEILELASKFYDYVFSHKDHFSDLEDDIPQ